MKQRYIVYRDSSNHYHIVDISWHIEIVDYGYEIIGVFDNYLDAKIFANRQGE